MATMLPDGIQVFTTPGEGVFYRFLQNMAKPDDRHISWYLPVIRGRESDFILYSQDVGLIVFEVKDWGVDQIVQADPVHFTLHIDGRRDTLNNPLHQARDYYCRILDMIKQDGRLISNQPYAYGKVKIPVNYGVVFPNINKFDYEQKGLGQVIPPGKIFFWDDLHLQSPICSDPTGRCFQKILKQMFPPLFDFVLTVKELNHLKQLLFPVVRIELPDRRMKWTRNENDELLKTLDHNQESIARQYIGGHRIITGPSGSGKTLILVHRAAILKQYHPDINILFVCYNITLVNYIKRLLANKHVPLGEGGVEVLHFYQLCGRITGEDILYEETDSAYYDMVIQVVLEKLPGYLLKYDAILIDEGQDFSDDMLKIVISLLNPQTNHLAIAIDENQNIYKKERSAWTELGINARGRVHKVAWIYRNTKEIARFAKAMVEKGAGLPIAADNRQRALFPETFETLPGTPPEINNFPNYGNIVPWVSEKIITLTEQVGYPLSEIAIIYTTKSPPDDSGINLPHLLEQSLDEKGIIHSWISEDYQAKRHYDITINSVPISTIHSVKGFDYACVFLLGLDWMVTGRWTEEQINNLAYVAVTRAREKLFIPYCSCNELINRLLSYM